MGIRAPCKLYRHPRASARVSIRRFPRRSISRELHLYQLLKQLATIQSERLCTDMSLLYSSWTHHPLPDISTYSCLQSRPYSEIACDTYAAVFCLTQTSRYKSSSTYMLHLHVLLKCVRRLRAIQKTAGSPSCYNIVWHCRTLQV